MQMSETGEVYHCSRGMKSRKVRDLSVSVTTFYMKYVGYWLATNYDEKRWRKIAMCYTFFIIMISLSTEMRALCFCWNDLNVSELRCFFCSVIFRSVNHVRLKTDATRKGIFFRKGFSGVNRIPFRP